MQSIDKKIQWYLSEFREFERGMNGEKQTPVHSLRRNAMDSFAKLGFPNSRQEEWRFTNILPIVKADFRAAAVKKVRNVSREELRKHLLGGAINLVFVNGVFSSELSDTVQLPGGIYAGSLAAILKSDPAMVQQYIASLIKGGEDAFTALNTAFFRDGAFIYIPAGKEPEKVLHMVFISAGEEEVFSVHPRNIIVSGQGAVAKIDEVYLGQDGSAYLNNSVTEIFVGDNSVVEHNKFQTENPNSYHIGTTYIMMGSNCSYTSNSVSIGGSIVRNNIYARLGAGGSECTLNGLSVGGETQTIDNHTTIDHSMPNCSSHELYKSILDGKAKGVFNGKIFVRKDAQKTDAKQTNKTLLLSDAATINTKPQLEIFADDVKCTHGATIGQLDAEQLFYLRTRGIGSTEARDILTLAFAGDVIERITVSALRDRLKQMIGEKLDKIRGK